MSADKGTNNLPWYRKQSVVFSVLFIVIVGYFAIQSDGFFIETSEVIEKDISVVSDTSKNELQQIEKTTKSPFDIMVSLLTLLSIFLTAIYIIYQINGIKEDGNIKNNVAKSIEAFAKSNSKQATALQTQADAQSIQAKALRMQADIANKSLYAERFRHAVETLDRTTSNSSRIFAINEAIDVTETFWKDYNVSCRNLYRAMLDKISYEQIILHKNKGNPPTIDEVKNINFKGIQMHLILGCYSQISKFKDENYIDPIDSFDDGINQVFQIKFNPGISLKTGKWYAHTIRNKDFSNFQFIDCAFNGLDFSGCNLMNTIFQDTKCLRLSNCIIGKSSATLDIENLSLGSEFLNTIKDCYIWQSDIASHVIEYKVNQGEIKLLKQHHYEAWNKLQGSMKMSFLDAMTKDEPIDFSSV